jgi:hypothetical protein
MNEEQAKKWLEDTVSDIFMDFCFYRRKEDEDMSVKQLRDLMDNAIISKETMIEVFTKQIEKEY